MASGDKMVLENPRKQQAQQVNQIQEPGTVKQENQVDKTLEVMNDICQYGKEICGKSK